ncbi:hypothetical protein V6N12_008954 [Hibiscus sabdariffa]|uniref:Early flowering 3 n=1 Tax=Hibiscus sabdariffa TaxID=183260 RepID=A0ABR2C643_9ROSI
MISGEALEMMMRGGGGDEAKVISPLFPRLHVNESDQGGQRAPPRNKMALYGHLNVPSQRFESGSLSMLLPNNCSVPSISSSHGGGDESSMFMPFYNSHESSILVDKFHSHSVPVTKLKGNQERKSMDTTPAIPQVSKSSTLQPLNFSDYKKFSTRKLGFGDDLMLPTPILSGIDKNFSCSQQSKGPESFSKMNQGEDHRDLMERPNSIPSTKCSSVDLWNREDGWNAQLHNEHRTAHDDMIFRENILVGSDRCVENGSKVGNESCLRESLGVDNGSSNMLENKSKAGAISRNKNGRGASMVKSISPLDICPDDVAGIVQRSIARSPQMVLEDSLNVSSIKKSPSNYVLEPPLVLKDNSHKPSIGIKRASDDAVAKLPLPFAIDDTNKGQGKHRPRDVSFSGNPLSTSTDENTSPSRCCFSPTGNQWLVPIMSHSEGLVYKPYTGPCPPTVGFLAPIYGNCGGIPNASHELSDSGQHGIGILPGNPPLGPTYFLHYGMPVSNPPVSSLAVEQISSFNGFGSKGNQFSTSDASFATPWQSSCSMSSEMSQAISYCARKLPELIENETQASVGSSPSPSKRAKRDALPLFPTEPTMPTSNHDGRISTSREQPIKVVPHNPISATESAARIFQSIQEERKQYK